jgi:hypothetical protein
MDTTNAAPTFDPNRRNLYRFAMTCDRMYRLRLHLANWQWNRGLTQQHCIRRDLRAAGAVKASIRQMLCQDGRIDADVDAIRRNGRIYNR